MEYDVVVVGGGPAGLAAACYCIQAQHSVALISPGLGGKVSYPYQLRGLPAVESVRGADLVQQFEGYVEAKINAYLPREAKAITQTRDRTFQITLENTELITARVLIICTGAQPQRLYVPGERDYMGRGVSYSAISHAQFFRKRNIAVVGGERAAEAVLKLAAIAGRVHFVMAHDRDLSTGGWAERILKHPRVSLFRGWEVQQIVGDEFVTGLGLVAVNGETRLLPVDGVFIELGLLPNNELVHDLVALDDAGRIIVNHRCETSVPGIFAAGDVTNVYAEQVPVAIGEGVKAALSAWSYLVTYGHDRPSIALPYHPDQQST